MSQCVKHVGQWQGKTTINGRVVHWCAKCIGYCEDCQLNEQCRVNYGVQVRKGDAEIGNEQEEIGVALSTLQPGGAK